MAPRRAAFVGLALLLAAPLATTGEVRDPNDRAVRFVWAFAAWRGGEDGPRPVPITGDMALASGTQLKLLVGPTEQGFVYVYHRGPDGAITALFPLRPGKIGAPGEIYIVPPGGSWIVLDNAEGIEEFHVLASADPLVELERLLAAHERARGDARRALAGQIDAEVRKLRSRPLPQPAERPVRIAGSIRGETPSSPDWRDELERMAVEISADRFFARTFSIEHR